MCCCRRTCCIATAWVVLLIALIVIQAGFLRKSDVLTSALLLGLTSFRFGGSLVYQFWCNGGEEPAAFEDECSTRQSQEDTFRDEEIEAPDDDKEELAFSIPAEEPDDDNYDDEVQLVLGDGREPQHEPRQRLFYLDNIKIFLIALVVSHHVTCAFGGCDQASWFLIVGFYDSPFQKFGLAFVTLNQAYFMPLFFFISAYLTPSSYDRKGRRRFMLDKAKRLYIPAVFATVAVVPLCILLALAEAGLPLAYVAAPGHCWFLYWLLLLNWVYSTLCPDGESLEEGSPNSAKPLPGTLARMLLGGAIICGLCQFVVDAALWPSSFGAMPISIGSIICDLFMFRLGVAAKRNGWMEGPITAQMDISVWLLRSFVIVEAVATCVLLPMADHGLKITVLAFIAAGLLCVDMSLAVLEGFQRYLDFETPITRYFAEASYTVYLIHPVVIVIVTSVYIWIYNQVMDEPIQFDQGKLSSTTAFPGPGNGSLVLFMSWLLTNIVSHALVWPLAWRLRQLPGLNKIL